MIDHVCSHLYPHHSAASIVYSYSCRLLVPSTALRVSDFPTHLRCLLFFMPLLSKNLWCGSVFLGTPSSQPSLFVIHPVIPILHAVISVYLVDGFQWNLKQIFIMWVDIAEKVFKVRSQRSRSLADRCYNAGRMHFDDVALWLTCLFKCSLYCWLLCVAVYTSCLSPSECSLK